MSFLRFGVHVCASVLAGIFLGLAFPDFSLWPLALVAMVLMLAVIDSVRVCGRQLSWVVSLVWFFGYLIYPGRLSLLVEVIYPGLRCLLSKHLLGLCGRVVLPSLLAFRGRNGQQVMSF